MALAEEHQRAVGRVGAGELQVRRQYRQVAGVGRRGHVGRPAAWRRAHGRLPKGGPAQADVDTAGEAVALRAPPRIRRAPTRAHKRPAVAVPVLPVGQPPGAQRVAVLVPEGPRQATVAQHVGVLRSDHRAARVGLGEPRRVAAAERQRLFAANLGAGPTRVSCLPPGLRADLLPQRLHVRRHHADLERRGYLVPDLRLSHQRSVGLGHVAQRRDAVEAWESALDLKLVDPPDLHCAGQTGQRANDRDLGVGYSFGFAEEQIGGIALRREAKQQVFRQWSRLEPGSCLPRTESYRECG